MAGGYPRETILEISETSGAEGIAVAGTTTIGNAITLNGAYQTLCIEVENIDDTHALDAFGMEIQTHKGGAWVSRQSTWSVAGDLIFINGAPVTLAAEAKANFIYVIRGVWAVRFTGSANTGTSGATITGIASVV